MEIEGFNSFFGFLNPKQNDLLSKMKSNDLQELLVLLDDYYLSLRDELNLSEDATFGLELEFENADRGRIEQSLLTSPILFDWTVVSDGSLVRGAEVNSPILRDTKESWDHLDSVCSIIKHNAVIGNNSSSHIHIGAQTIGTDKEAWVHFLKLWSVYENILFRFAYGEYLTGRPKIKKYAASMAKKFQETIAAHENDGFSWYFMLYDLSFEKYNAVSLIHTRFFMNDEVKPELGNTIEFRCPNGTLDPVIWQNNVNVFTKLLGYAKDTSSYQQDIVDRRGTLVKDIQGDLRFYNEIYLPQALEFADLVFDNNLDKLYFLKQYLKSFEISNRSNHLLKSKELTKKTRSI